jgi:hypothetical protein
MKKKLTKKARKKATSAPTYYRLIKSPKKANKPTVLTAKSKQIKTLSQAYKQLGKALENLVK